MSEEKKNISFPIEFKVASRNSGAYLEPVNEAASALSLPLQSLPSQAITISNKNKIDLNFGVKGIYSYFLERITDGNEDVSVTITRGGQVIDQGKIGIIDYSGESKLGVIGLTGIHNRLGVDRGVIDPKCLKTGDQITLSRTPEDGAYVTGIRGTSPFSAGARP